MQLQPIGIASINCWMPSQWWREKEQGRRVMRGPNTYGEAMDIYSHSLLICYILFLQHRRILICIPPLCRLFFVEISNSSHSRYIQLQNLHHRCLHPLSNSRSPSRNQLLPTDRHEPDLMWYIPSPRLPQCLRR